MVTQYRSIQLIFMASYLLVNFFFYFCFYFQLYTTYCLHRAFITYIQLQMELLKDPKQDRVIKNVELPYHKHLPNSLLFKQGRVDWRLLRDFLKRQGRISKSDFHIIIKSAAYYLRNEPNLIRIEDPITIVGDIHGQFYDFIRILDTDIGGHPKNTRYLFLGDYVDRGNFNIEVLLLILSLKIAYPSSITMLRGNHQCRYLTSQFNFRTQCLIKYGQTTYDLIMQMFDTLPIAALVNGKFLCVHGGLSPDMRSIKDIQKVDRFREVPHTGLFCDLLWSDPTDSETGILHTKFIQNKPRGCSYYFGYQVSKQFLQMNSLLTVIRAHEAQQQGFKMYNWGNSCFPKVITLFSAPNYCDYYKNKGAVIKILNNNLNIQQFLQNPHPFILPNFMDGLSFSLPIIIEKVTQIFLHLMKLKKQYKDVQIPLQYTDKRQIYETFLKNFKKTVQINKELTELQGNCPDDKLLETGSYRDSLSKSFNEKKKIDQFNESIMRHTV